MTSNPARDAILHLDAVSRVHGSGAGEVRALGPVTISVWPGEFVAIMGPSGSGKSTLLSLAGALDQPTSGRVFVAGRDLGPLGIKELAEMRRKVIGFVFQDLNLLPGLTALENVALPLELDGESLGTARSEATRALARVELEDKHRRFPDELSGGERQRVAIARAFVGRRTFLLADEPTGALDSVTGELILRSLRAECDRGRTIVLVTHDSSHAAWADRVLFLRDGVVVDETKGPSSVPPLGSTRPKLVEPKS